MEDIHDFLPLLKKDFRVEFYNQNEQIYEELSKYIKSIDLPMVRKSNDRCYEENVELDAKFYSTKNGKAFELLTKLLQEKEFIIKIILTNEKETFKVYKLNKAQLHWIKPDALEYGSSEAILYNAKFICSRIMGDNE